MSAQTLTKNDLLVDELLIGVDGGLKMYYAPHNEYINEKAVIVIVGITPGWTQMKTAFIQLLKCLESQHSTEQALKEVKKVASFSGSMRTNLIHMLDECGVHEAVHVKSSSQLFDEYRDLVHTTSVIKYPVFYQGENYTGYRPSIQKSTLLSKYAFHVFPNELGKIKETALIIPLGKTVETVLKKLIKEDKLPKHFYLFGFPHPSGANGHREKQFQQRKDSLRSIVKEWKKYGGSKV